MLAVDKVAIQPYHDDYAAWRLDWPNCGGRDGVSRGKLSFDRELLQYAIEWVGADAAEGDGAA